MRAALLSSLHPHEFFFISTRKCDLNYRRRRLSRKGLFLRQALLPLKIFLAFPGMRSPGYRIFVAVQLNLLKMATVSEKQVGQTVSMILLGQVGIPDKLETCACSWPFLLERGSTVPPFLGGWGKRGRGESGGSRPSTDWRRRRGRGKERERDKGSILLSRRRVFFFCPLSLFPLTFLLHERTLFLSVFHLLLSHLKREREKEEGKLSLASLFTLGGERERRG